MPTSNGQVSRYDIRRGAVVSTGIADDAVITAKIPDLAVTFPDKIDSPIWSSTFGKLLFHNSTVTTTSTSFGSVTVDVPSWVNDVSVLAVGYFQISVSSAVLAVAGIGIEAEVLGGNSLSVAASSTGLLVVSRQASLAGVAGASFEIDMEVYVNSGTNSSNHASLRGIVVGTR